MNKKLQREYRTDKYYNDEQLFSKGIYMIKCLENNKIYIGQTKGQGGFNTRWRGHLWNLNKNNNKNIYLQNNYNKYGLNNLEFSIVEYCNNKNKEYINKRERYWIKHYKSNNRNYGMNLTEGGEGFGTLVGEDNSKALLKNVDVENIKLKLIEDADYSKLAKEYNVDVYIIREIKYCDTYKTIREDLNEQLKAINKTVKGESVGTSILDKKEVYQIKKLLVEGIKSKELCKNYNVSMQTIYAIKHLTNWRDIGSEFNEALLKLKQAPKRLNLDSVKEIREKYATGLYTQEELAKEYKTNKGTIGNIIRNKYYLDRSKAS